MTTFLRAAGAALIIAFALSSCAYYPDNIPGLVGKYNGSIEQMQEEAILTNIVRASEDAPLGFTQLAVVRGSGTVTEAMGLPNVTLAAGQKAYVFGPNGLSNTNNTNFDLGVLESKEFWLGMLTPLAPSTVAFFVNQGVPREILFYLYVQRAEVSSPGRPTEVDLNNPLDPNFPQFTDYLRQALRLGLTADTVSRSFDFGPPIPAEKASDVKDLIELAKAGLSIRPVPTKAGLTYQIQGTQSGATLCFDQARASVDIAQALGSTDATCAALKGELAQTKDDTGKPFAFQQRGGTRPAAAIKIYPRSTYDVFRYLGALVKTGIKSGQYVDLATDEAKLYSGDNPLGTKLFVVQKNAEGDKFLSVKVDGNTYSIPKGATTTIEVLALLRQLVALSTSITALPQGGTVTTVVP